MLKAIRAQKAEYYLTPDCPVEGEEIEARFGGKNAATIGLAGFSAEAHLRLAKGLNPHTGDKLTARLKSDRVEATDITVTVPKELSLLIEVAGDQRAKDALWKANDYAMGLIEKKAKVRVRKGGVNNDRDTGNIVYASLYHGTTRPITEKSEPSHASFELDGVERLFQSANDNRSMPDPHAHIHNYVYNLSYDQTEGMMKAMKRHWFDFGGRVSIEEKFHKRLAKELRKIGYDAHVIDTKNATMLEIRGVSEELVSLFSRRQDRIEDAKKSKPYLDAEGNKTFRKKMDKAKAQLSQVVRESKDDMPSVTRSELHGWWKSRMTPRQFTGLEGLVRKSKEKGAARWHAELDHWQAGIARHASKLRQFVTSRETERGIEHGREGISR